MKKRVVDIIFDTLADNGIEQAFCVTGGGAMYLDNALCLNKRIKTVFNHHEQGCSIAAEGYARCSRGAKPAVVCLTSGPGGTNALTGVMGAYLDSIPMVVISGQIRWDTTVAQCGLNLRRRGEQEFDIVHSVGNMTKYVKMVIDPLSIRQEVQKAYDIAMHGRRGPVWLDIPMNVQRAEVEEDELLPVLPPPKEIACSDEELRDLVRQLASAKSPCILAGSAIESCGLEAPLERFLEHVRIPTVSAMGKPSVMYWEHPLFFGITGGIGSRSGNFIIENADLLLVLGCSLGFKQTSFVQENFAPNAKVIMVDVNPDEAKKPGLHVAQFIHSDVHHVLTRIPELGLAAAAPEPWIAHCRMLKGRFDLFEGAIGKPEESVNCYNAWKVWDAMRPDDDVIAMGNSSAMIPGLNCCCRKHDQIMITNTNCGSMGYGLPAAVGAAVAMGREVTLMDGDGSLMMNLQELQTAVTNKLPIKIILFVNNAYACVIKTCKAYFGGKMFGCTPESGLGMPDFAKVSGAFGIPHRLCRTNGELESGMAWIKEQPGIAMLEVRQIDPNPIMPLVKSRLNDDGTSSAPKPYDMFPFLEKTVIEECLYKG